MAAIAEENKVTYPFLGKSGLRVANLCLGTMTFGESSIGIPGQNSEQEAHKLLDRYVEWGGNFLDTADIYSAGKSEQIIGTWLEKQPREKFVIATKVRADMGTKDNINCAGLNRRHIVASVEKSLERLRTNYIDLYQPHGWDDATPIEETLRTLDDLVRCGKVRYVGYCNVIGWQMMKIVDTCKAMGINPVVSLQQQYSLACRESEYEPFQVCKLEGLGVLPWSGLKGGLFSGKIKRDTVPQEGRLAWVAQDEAKRKTQACPAYSSFTEQTFQILDAVEDIGKKHGRSVPQVALRWLLQKDVVSSVIIGARTLAQLDDNMGAANGWKLTEEDMKRLDEVSSPANPYPYEMVFRLNAHRRNPNTMNQYVRSTY